MSKQKILTNEELEASRKLKSIWLSKKQSLGLTQIKIAKVVGVKTQGGVGHFLNGRSALTMESLLAFSAILKVSPDEIYPKLAKKISNILFARSQQESDDLKCLKDYYLKADSRGRESILERARIEAARNVGIDDLPDFHGGPAKGPRKEKGPEDQKSSITPSKKKKPTKKK